jgi:hypothetical protein
LLVEGGKDMEDDLGELQREICGAAKQAATAGDWNVLSVLGPLTGEMARKYQEWRNRFQQIPVTNGHPQSIPRSAAENATPSEDFTGKPIRGFEFGGEKIIVGTYKEMLVALAGQMLRKHPDKFDAVAARVRGRKPYFSNIEDDLTAPRKLKPGLYIETCFPANQAVKVCRDLVEAFGYSSSSLRMDVVPFRTRAVKRTARSVAAPKKKRRRDDFGDIQEIG